jgi:hypothetical protein
MTLPLPSELVTLVNPPIPEPVVYLLAPPPWPRGKFLIDPEQ